MENTATVVNLYKEAYDQYIGRAGATLERFGEYFYKRLNEDPEFKRRIHLLKGLRLGCFCKPKPCHGDIIVEYLNSI